jgi:hypothetical protein
MFKFLFVIILLVLAGVVYWHGEKAWVQQQGYKCDWQLEYAICQSKTGKPLPQPSLVQIFKYGIDLKTWRQ